MINDHSIFHEHDPVGIARHPLVMGDDDERLACFVGNSEKVEYLRGALAVERTGGFVGEQHRRAIRKCTYDCHALLLTTGELVGHLVLESLEAECMKEPRCFATSFTTRCPGQPEGEFDVLADREISEEIQRLQNDSDVGATKVGSLGA